ncbi:MAG: hypothetical protein AAFS10_04470 [Myxococcota bacterium]
MMHTTTPQAFGALLLTLLMAASGCAEYSDSSETDDCAQGEPIEVEDEPYCVFIEEGFLTADCPPEYPNGFDLMGAIVCSDEEEIPEEAVRAELEEKGLLSSTCSTASDCPQPNQDPFCENEVAVTPAPAQAECVEGVCGFSQAAIADSRTDCAAMGLTCQDGACVGSSGECVMDTDCPQPDPVMTCQGTTAIMEVMSSSCVQGQCISAGDQLRNDCAAEGLACEAGFCVDPSTVTIPPGESLEVNNDHRTCTTDADCVSVYTGCGACEGECQGVMADYAQAYGEALSCENYQGPECDFDCDPSFGLTELSCQQGLCTIATIAP